MEFYTSPLDFALAHAFGVLDESQNAQPHCSSRRTTVSPKKRKSTTVEPSYSVRSHRAGHSVEIELPGVSKNSVTLDVNGRTLTVAGDRYMKQKPEVEKLDDSTDVHADGKRGIDDALHSGAVSRGSKKAEMEEKEKVGAEAEEEESRFADPTAEIVTYKIQFTLPASSDPAAAKAELQNGLLAIQIPRIAPELHSINVE